MKWGYWVNPMSYLFLFLVLIKGMRKWCESRSSHRRCSTKKVVLKNFTMFTRKHLCWILFLIKLQAFRPTTLLKWTPTQTFSCEYCEIFKNTYFEKHLWTAASVSKRFSWVTSEAESFYADLFASGLWLFLFYWELMLLWVMRVRFENLNHNLKWSVKIPSKCYT